MFNVHICFEKPVSGRYAEDYSEENSDFGEKNGTRVFHLDPVFSTRPGVFQHPVFPTPTARFPPSRDKMEKNDATSKLIVF